MEIQEFITQTAKGTIPLGTLTTIAADRAAFGDDVLVAFRTQVELRSSAASTVLETASQAGRDTLLASEQRSYDAAMRERDAILGLQRHVEQRTEQRGFVPATQTATETRVGAASPVLVGDQRMAGWLEQRGGYPYAGERGVERLSLGRLVRVLATGNRAGLSDLEQRVLAEGSGPAGGFTVPEIVATRFIDRVRDALVVQRAGAQIVPMTSDTVHMARLAQPGLVLSTSPSSPAVNALVSGWKAENDPIAEADLVLERVTLNAKTLPILVRMSVELSEDSVNIDQIIETELSRSMALELDRAALVGGGSPAGVEPTGIANQASVQTAPLGLGSPPDWDFLIDAAGMLWTQNFDPNAVIYNTPLAITLAKVKDTISGQPLARPAVLDGMRAFRTSAAGSLAFVGDFSQLLIGMRTSFRLETTRVGAGAFENLQIVVRAYLRADVALAHPEAFVVLS